MVKRASSGNAVTVDQPEVIFGKKAVALAAQDRIVERPSWL